MNKTVRFWIVCESEQVILYTCIESVQKKRSLKLHLWHKNPYAYVLMYCLVFYTQISNTGTKNNIFNISNKMEQLLLNANVRWIHLLPVEEVWTRLFLVKSQKCLYLLLSIFKPSESEAESNFWSNVSSHFLAHQCVCQRQHLNNTYSDIS